MPANLTPATPFGLWFADVKLPNVHNLQCFQRIPQHTSLIWCILFQKLTHKILVNLLGWSGFSLNQGGPYGTHSNGTVEGAWRRNEERFVSVNTPSPALKWLSPLILSGSKKRLLSTTCIPKSAAYPTRRLLLENDFKTRF